MNTLKILDDIVAARVRHLHTVGIKTVRRHKWTPPSLRDPRNLIQAGTEVVNGVEYVRLHRWSKKRRAFVLEALVLPNSPILRLMRNGYL